MLWVLAVYLACRVRVGQVPGLESAEEELACRVRVGRVPGLESVEEADEEPVVWKADDAALVPDREPTEERK